jgi:GGDEF domain-containing protein
LLNIDALTSLSTKHTLLQKLARVLTVAQRNRELYAILVIHLANADAIETQDGREMADRAMVFSKIEEDSRKMIHLVSLT